MEPLSHILVVDDHREIRDLVARFMTEQGYRVTTAKDGREMSQALAENHVDLVVLDLMLPGDDGLALCRDLRAHSTVPVIMLTAMGEETDRIVGLEIGADDYITKPFNPRELLARVKAVLRRTQSPREATNRPDGTVAAFDGWRLDLRRRELESPVGVMVPLSTGEYALLAAFVRHPQRVLSREDLAEIAQGRGGEPSDRSVDTQVSRLRRKIEIDSKDPRIIKTVWGGGYVFTPMVTIE